MDTISQVLLPTLISTNSTFISSCVFIDIFGMVAASMCLWLLQLEDTRYIPTGWRWREGAEKIYEVCFLIFSFSWREMFKETVVRSSKVMPQMGRTLRAISFLPYSSNTVSNTAPCPPWFAQKSSLNCLYSQLHLYWWVCLECRYSLSKHLFPNREHIKTNWQSFNKLRFHCFLTSLSGIQRSST